MIGQRRQEQAEMPPHRFLGERVGNKGGIADGKWKPVFYPAAMDRKELARMGAVSYTHLDVYKRQVSTFQAG